MDEHPRGAKISPEIYVYATNKNFLNVYDALRIDKVKLEVAGYDQASGKQTGIAGAWLDVDDLRLLIHLVLTRQFKDVLDRARFEKFGGSDRDGAVESRTLVLEWDPGQNNKFGRYPYRLTIANGPGQRTPNGAVQPAGEPASRQSIRLPEPDLMKILLAVGDYVRAYEAAHHHRIVAEKVRELQEKMAGRAERRLPVPAAPDEEERASAPAPRPGAPPSLHVVSGPGSPAAAARTVPARPAVPAGPVPAAVRPVASAGLAPARPALPGASAPAAVRPVAPAGPAPGPERRAPAPPSRPVPDMPASRLERPTRAS